MPTQPAYPSSPLRSALQARLTPEQQKDHLDFCDRNVQRQRKDRDQLFSAKFLKYQKMAMSDFGHRRHGIRDNPQQTSIFDRENFSVQLVRSVVKFILSRIHKDVFGSSPWFSVTPQGPHDAALASQVTKHSGWKLDAADWKGMGREVMQTALELGWAATKTAWSKIEDVSESLRPVLYDPKTKQNLVTQTGEFIYADDDTEEAPEGWQMPADLIAPAIGPVEALPLEGEEPPPTSLPAPSDLELLAPQPEGEMPLPESGEMGMAPQAPIRVFSKDPTIPAPDAVNGFTFHDSLVEERIRLYSGLDVSVLGWNDVTWEMNARSAELGKGCSFMSVTHTRSIEQLRSVFNPDGQNTKLEETFKTLHNKQNELADGDKPKEGTGEPEVEGTDDPENPTIRVVECYYTRRVIPGGPESRIFLCYAEESQQLIWMEYLSQISPRGQAPIHITAINRVPGRAYGRGFYEIFEMVAEMLDKSICGIIYRNEYHANVHKFITKKAKEAMNGEPMVIGPDKWIPLETKDQPMGDQFYLMALPDMDSRTWDLVELCMQLIQTESGVSNASQGDMSSLPSNGTATGVNSLLESSSVLHQYTLNEIKDGLEKGLKFSIECVYFYQDQDETFAYLEGDSGAIEEQQAAKEQLGQVAGGIPKETGVMTLAQANALADMPMNVQILLSRAKSQQLREAAMAVYPQIADFLTRPPQHQKYLRPAIEEYIKTVEIPNPQRMLPSVEEIERQIQALAEQPPEDVQASERINFNYKDAPPAIQRQIEAKLGLDPLTPEQEAEWVASQAKESSTEPKPANDLQ